MIQCVLRNNDPVERCLRIGHPAIRMSAIQRNHAPSHFEVAADTLDWRENVRAERMVGSLARDGTLQDWLKGLPDIEALRLAANEHRYRLEVARRLTRPLGCRDPHLFCFDGGFACRRRGIELWLELGFSGGPPRPPPRPTPPPPPPCRLRSALFFCCTLWTQRPPWTR